MLAVPAEKSMMPKLAGNGGWAFTQKVDGERALIQSGDLKVFGRSGRLRTKKLPPKLASALGRLPGGIVLDGELMLDGSLWLFDAPLVELGGKTLVDLSSPYSDRLRALGELVRQVWPQQGLIRPIPYATSPEHKLKLFKYLQESHAEGIVARKMDGVYTPGARSADMVKIKFQRSCECVVMGVAEEGKANLVLGMYDVNGKLIEVGKVSSLTGDGSRANTGDVVEVQYLSFSEGHRLVQPVNPRLRRDKMAVECTTDQLRPINTHLVCP